MNHVATTVERDFEGTIHGRTLEEVCVEFQTKIRTLARQAERSPRAAGMARDDLESLGRLGLLEAWQRFDPDRGIAFSTYAEYRIRGAMFDAMRVRDPLSRRRRDLARRIGRAADVVRRRLGREPSHHEVAHELEMTPTELQRARSHSQNLEHVSLDHPVGGDGSLRLGDRLPTDEADALGAMLRQQSKQILRQAIDRLADREKQCVLMYYGQELSQAEIAEVYGVSVSRISQILSVARGKLRKQLQGEIGPGDV